jgi:hypothetical protein
MFPCVDRDFGHVRMSLVFKEGLQVNVYHASMMTQMTVPGTIDRWPLLDQASTGPQAAVRGILIKKPLHGVPMAEGQHFAF